jgi:hypothetical protein
MHRFKRVSVKKLSVEKRSVMNGSVLRCVYRDSACIRVVEGFRSCFVAGVDGRIRRMCPKFKESSDYPFRKDLVRKAVLEFSAPK